MKPYKKYTAEPCLFLGIDTTLLSNNALGFWKNLLEEVQRVVMTIVEKTRDEKLQYDINRAAAKIYALLSGKTDECAYLMYEKILPPQQHKIIEEAELIFSLLGKSFEKQTKATEEQGEKPVQALKSLNPK